MCFFQAEAILMSERTLVVGTLSIRLWKVTATMTKKPKKRIWMRRPPMMICSPVFIELLDFPAMMPPPGKGSTISNIWEHTGRGKQTGPLHQKRENISANEYLGQPLDVDKGKGSPISKSNDPSKLHVDAR